MRPNASYFADQSDPDRNRSFSRRWSEEAMSLRQLEHIAVLEAEHGHPERAAMMSLRAAVIRVGASKRWLLGSRHLVCGLSPSC